MIKNELKRLGDKITRLRIAKNLKQSELAYEAGISERTLQRIEAGDVVKSNGLLQVISYLGKLEELLAAVDTPSVSPYEIVSHELKHNRKTSQSVGEDSATRPRRSRVRHSNKRDTGLTTPVKTIVWPEDQT